jgi:exodeoxyribonuclease VII small subunit
MKTNLTYELAYRELAEIAQEIETESVSVFFISEMVNRASELIEFCQNKLRATETEVNKIIKQMENQK